MFTMEVPYVPPYETPVVLAQATATPTQPDYLLKTCDEVPSAGGAVTAMNLVSPAPWLVTAVLRQNGRQVSTEELMALVASVKLTQLQGVKHGQLITHSPDGRIVYEYRSEPGYVGKDQAIFMAEFEGKRYKIIANVVVSMNINENDPQCPIRPTLIKITKPSTGDSGFGSGYNLASVSVTFADLAGGAVGQAVGNTITLDDNAAGHNWFIDATPWDNSEYLPTSNPYEWVAKEGTAAYGKMDMLSVLLHEYGHALGIDHSADNHDYMATTLTPGVRRMPSAEELALMQELIGVAKGEMVADASTPSLTLPLQGGGGLPIPLGAGFGLAFLGRMRKSSYGGTSIDVVGAPTITQYAVAANATFTNLNTPAGWNTQGSVDIASGTSTGLSTGSATLSEVSTSQTRLSQVFMLNEQDRYLSFTLSGTALDNLTGALPHPNPLPQAGEGANVAPGAAQPLDAFEVALLDANTGANLLGGIGLSHSDAFLNIQGDGTEHTAAGVIRTDNPDGSRTYRVDLTGVAKNAAVNLSFDLLGFDQNKPARKE